VCVCVCVCVCVRVCVGVGVGVCVCVLMMLLLLLLLYFFVSYLLTTSLLHSAGGCSGRSGGEGQIRSVHEGQPAVEPSEHTLYY
jgi:hypothetical protein